MELTPAESLALKRVIGYKGRKPLRYGKFIPGMSVASYWDGGSRDYWYIVNTKTFACKAIPQNGTPFDRMNLKCDALAPNEVLVRASVYMGKPVSPVVYMNG